MKLSRLCTEFDKGKWKIHQFGYDENNESKKVTTIYQDYFYYLKEYINDISNIYGLSVEEGKVYKTLNNEDACKVYYRSIKNKKALHYQE